MKIVELIFKDKNFALVRLPVLGLVPLDIAGLMVDYSDYAASCVECGKVELLANLTGSGHCEECACAE